MRRAALPDKTGASGAAKSACSLEQVVSPWIGAALVRDAGWLGLRGQRDARSIAEKSLRKVYLIVDGNNSRCKYTRMNNTATIRFNRDAHSWTPETRFILSFVHNGLCHTSGHASIADCQREAARFGLKTRIA